jgi:hypothetical protein
VRHGIILEGNRLTKKAQKKRRKLARNVHIIPHFAIFVVFVCNL